MSYSRILRAECEEREERWLAWLLEPGSGPRPIPIGHTFDLRTGRCAMCGCTECESQQGVVGQWKMQLLEIHNLPEAKKQ
jgi:hypothetical protein